MTQACLVFTSQGAKNVILCELITSIYNLTHSGESNVHSDLHSPVEMTTLSCLNHFRWLGKDFKWTIG